MIKFSIKSSLAAGLTHRLKTLDGQVVVDTCKDLDAIQAVRMNLAVVDEINKANEAFVLAVDETEMKKRAIFDEIQAEYRSKEAEKSQEERAAYGRELTARYNEKAAEIQKESKADPETVVTVELSDEKYEKVLMPLFKKTVQLWDVNGDGNGQALFLAVADALEAIEHV